MKLTYSMEIMDLDGSLIAVPIDCEDNFRGILHINDTTASILRMLENETTETEMIKTMKQQYDASEEDIRRNISKTLTVLKKYQLISS